jgi:hypothetical protein
MGKSSSRRSAPQIGGAYTENDIAAYQAEMLGAPVAQAKAIPAAVALERKLLPELQSYYFDTLGASTGGLQSFYDQMQARSIASQQGYGTGLVGAYGAMGAAATQQAIAGLDPTARRNYELMQGQAADELAMGTALSPQEAEIARGAARAAAEARGLQFSRQGGDLEVLNTYNMGLQRQAQRRQYAAGALQTAQGMQQYGGQVYAAPAMQGSSIYSIPGMISGAEGVVAGYGPRTLQPESQYMSDLRTSRMQGQMAADQAAATRSAGAMSGIATLGAALITKFCWVAREVYGENNPKWLQFREYLFVDSPDWLFDLYAKHGEDFSKFISDKPLIKWVVRKAMDFAIKRYESRLTSIITNHA